MQIKHIFALTLVLKVRVFVTVGKDSSAKHPCIPGFPGLPFANLVSRVLSFSNTAAISESEKTLGTMLLTCITDEEAHTSTVGFTIFALISREIFFARDVKSGLLRFYKWRPFRNFKVACVASLSVRFRRKERGTRVKLVKDREKSGASKRAGRGCGRKEGNACRQTPGF